MNNPAFNPSQNSAWVGSQQIPPQDTPQNSQGPQPRVNPVNQPPMYTGPVVPPRIQVVFKDRIEENNSPNVFVTLWSILGLAISGICFAVIYYFPDSIGFAQSAGSFIFTAILVVIGLTLIVSACVIAFRNRKKKANRQEKISSPSNSQDTSIEDFEE